MLHHLMVGTWTPPGAIFTFEFDDESFSLKLIKRTSINNDEPISWMTFDVGDQSPISLPRNLWAELRLSLWTQDARRNIYGASMKTYSSYTVKSPTEIIHHNSHLIGGHPRASSPDTKTRAIFILAANKPPYSIYCSPFYEYAGYGNIFSVNSDGGMEINIQNYEYSSESAIHGMVFDSTETYLYSADMWGNKIWTHKKDARKGKLALVGSLDAPHPGDHPRWVEIHPSGTYLYVLMEAGNNLAIYVIDQQTHMPVFTQLTYPLIPPGLDRKLYRADVVYLSHSNNYLFATSRANPTNATGYISAFNLGPVGNIIRQLCMNPTPTNGGHSNAVSPCPWSDEWLALTDDQEGWIEIYRWKDEWMARVAHCDVKEPGFGMNAIWYD